MSITDQGSLVVQELTNSKGIKPQQQDDSTPTDTIITTRTITTTTDTNIHHTNGKPQLVMKNGQQIENGMLSLQEPMQENNGSVDMLKYDDDDEDVNNADDEGPGDKHVNNDEDTDNEDEEEEEEEEVDELEDFDSTTSMPIDEDLLNNSHVQEDTGDSDLSDNNNHIHEGQVATTETTPTTTTATTDNNTSLVATSTAHSGVQPPGQDTQDSQGLSSSEESEKTEYERTVTKVKTIPEKKNYLISGLYSSVYRQTSPPPQLREEDSYDRYLENPQLFKFQLPMFAGEEAFLESDSDREFDLTYDIHSQFDIIYKSNKPFKKQSNKKRRTSKTPTVKTKQPLKQQQQKRRKISKDDTKKEKKDKFIKPSKYRYISNNRFVERSKCPSDVIAICSCKESCEEGCLNRDMQYLCSPKYCPTGNKCKNIAFNLRPPLKTSKGEPAFQVFWAGARGHGLKTLVNIKKDDFVIDYRGEIISQNESYVRVVNRYKGRTHHYFLYYDVGEVIDAGSSANEARFINHSCEPNLKVERWKLANYDEYQIGLFALRDIKAGEELTYDYGWESFSSNPSRARSKSTASTSSITESPLDSSTKDNLENRHVCLCGTLSCRRWLEKK